MAKDVDIVIGAQDKASAVLNSVAGKVGSFSSSFAAAGPLVAGIGAAVAAAAGSFFTLKAAIEGVVGSATKIDAMTDQARGLGATVGDLQAFQFAMAEAGNVDADNSIQSLQKMQKVVGEAATGLNQISVEAFKRLNLDAREISMRGPVDQFLAVQEAISQIENVSERAAVAQQLLGKSAADLIPALIAEQGEFAASMQAANDLGATVSDEGAAGIAAMNDALGRVATGFEGIFNQVAVALAPAIEAIATELASWLPPVIEVAKEWLPYIVDTFVDVLDAATEVFNILSRIATLDVLGKTDPSTTWRASVDAARAAAEEAGEAARKQAEAITEASAFVDKEADKARETAAKKAEADAKRAQEKAANETKRAQEAIAKKAADEAERIVKLKEKELQSLEKQRIELSRGKEAAHAYALEMEGLDKATSQKIAADQAAIDLQKAQQVDKSQGFNATQGRLLQFGRGGDPKITIMQQIQAAVEKIVTNTKPGTSQNPLPLTGRNYPVAVVP